MTAINSVAASAHPACAPPAFNAKNKPKAPIDNVQATLELMTILDRSEQSGDCRIWLGPTDSSGHPMYRPAGCDCSRVRRVVYQLNGGKLMPFKPLDMHCNEKLCVNPLHIFQSTRSKIGKKAAKQGAWGGPARMAKIAIAKRAASKLNTVQASEIRNSPEAGPALAKR